MSQVLTPLWLEDLDGRRWIVCAPFRYASDLLHGIVEVPIGTETDLASVPRLFWGLVPQSGKYNKAAVLHDAGYRGALVTDTGRRIHLVKPLCDQLFLEAMLVCGVDGWLARRLYALVVRFGKKDGV